MPNRAREITAVRRDALGHITHVIGLDADGVPWTDPIDRVLNDSSTRKRSFFVSRGGESLLVDLRKNGAEVEFTSAAHGAIEVPDEKS